MSGPRRSRSHRGSGWGGVGVAIGGRCVRGRPGSAQAEIRVRPFARRRASTARPARVRMRIRKPWVFFRFRLFGWNVFFMTALSLVQMRTRTNASTSDGDRVYRRRGRTPASDRASDRRPRVDRRANGRAPIRHRSVRKTATTREPGCGGSGTRRYNPPAPGRGTSEPFPRTGNRIPVSTSVESAVEYAVAAR